MPLPSKPPDLFNREIEWNELAKFATSPGSGIQVSIVYGRRRQGKSYLLRRLITATKGFYYQAIEQESTLALADLGDSLGKHLGVGRLALADWNEAITRLAQIPNQASSGSPTPRVIVLDEFPYLLIKSPELSSVIQRVVDQSREEGWPPVRLILCGSALSLMASLLTGNNPLRGRILQQLLIQPFNYREAANFWGFREPKLALQVHSILGGTPGYKTLIRSIPEKLSEFDEWVVEEILNPTTALFQEDELLLGEAPKLTDRALYLSILSAIATGHSTQSEVAANLGREQRSVQHPLQALVQAAFLAKEEDLLRQRRPHYRIIEPIIRFHQVIRNSDLARYENRQAIEAWKESKATFQSLILGPHFEQLTREYVAHFAPSQITGGQINQVGFATIADRLARSSCEVDIVALQRGSGRRHKLIGLIGESKFRELGLPDLQRLEQICRQLSSKVVPASEIQLLLASATGFQNELVQVGLARPEVKLLGLNQLYTD